MLNAETKRRIDNARDILVGKVPDPKTQVEQITFAMIYKFMDDMDQISVKLGGKASFFNNGYEGFAWSKLMDKKLSGSQRLDLYVRALEGMANNPHIPQLFRDVFKGAFLPYRDSETLNLFLKEMNGFTYDHSEDLGDAYEYLLSIFATQGKAGQFRTPRHIIDFIVDCVDPDMHDSVLDPACGTAGFLISAYKHITEKHRDDPLTPDQKQRLTENFVGYDISPDMVRLSLVNMYLHQFPNPTIHEYDALTTEDRWDETFDVILANPPFMTPKGGIRPHKRFAVRANRSEVLFVDYIAEHLNVGGRAGVIVPEGIIFQSSNAYKALRKMLVEENYLYAVVSLPAGVFNPYSGVKTSILLLDKDLARRAERVLFVRVEQDGFDLGAQRREIEQNDLPEALAAVKAFQADLAMEPENSARAWAVEKARLGEDGDYNLSGERYRQVVLVSQKWPMVKLKECCKFIRGVTYSKKNEVEEKGNIILRANNIDITKNSLDLSDLKMIDKSIKLGDDLLLKENDIFICSASGSKEHIGKVAFINEDLPYYFGGFMAVIRCNEKVNPKYVFELLKSPIFRTHLNHSILAVNIRNLKSSMVYDFSIPFPPLEVQQEIVDEIEGYQKVIDGARQVVENYKPVIPIDPDWPLVKLGEVCETTSGGTPLRSITEYYEGGTIPWLRSGEVNRGYIEESELFITEMGLNNSSAKIFPINTVLVAMYGATAGQVGLLKFESSTNQAICGILPNDQYIPEFLYYFLLSKTEYFVEISGGGAQPNISQRIIKELLIPKPNISDQEKIVEALESERSVIELNKTLIERFETKIAARIQSVWGAG
ncbi:MAG: putative type I restriction enzymeP M protein [Chloroflexi bacterium ADurb.Bin120]|jgi:type I restriction enzyme M protein|uniref:site-specific DNA-methyltransferase (adenine-specific) n=1 Tax=Candidatus Brevifilum fermentans TaxID=1986204 RepID=A0A1Y6K8P8_9CHLR|nr:N-6 DNA methylase [Brevefilum fermentans]OQB84011.1 MAG: putative type I restriction enzymeP M protein [Chloroflexi bacterium ADurb.Bin120]SMX55248.1 Restriction modification system DNA specificity domain [Brevefilum fermentans]